VITAGALPARHPSSYREVVMTLWRWLPVFVLIYGLQDYSAGAADPKDQPKLKISEDEQKLIDLANEARKKEKLPPLKPNATLFAVARAHSNNMARQGKMEHVLDGKNVRKRLDAAHYNFGWYGENIAMGKKATLDQIMKGWMESKGHRANILSKNYTEIGVGIADDGNGTLYYTQVFGSQRKKR
jgi:uncharacterized protein YkwD